MKAKTESRSISPTRRSKATRDAELFLLALDPDQKIETNIKTKDKQIRLISTPENLEYFFLDNPIYILAYVSQQIYQEPKKIPETGRGKYLAHPMSQKYLKKLVPQVCYVSRPGIFDFYPAVVPTIGYIIRPFVRHLYDLYQFNLPKEEPSLGSLEPSISREGSKKDSSLGRDQTIQAYTDQFMALILDLPLEIVTPEKMVNRKTNLPRYQGMIDLVYRLISRIIFTVYDQVSRSAEPTARLTVFQFHDGWTRGTFRDFTRFSILSQYLEYLEAKPKVSYTFKKITAVKPMSEPFFNGLSFTLHLIGKTSVKDRFRARIFGQDVSIEGNPAYQVYSKYGKPDRLLFPTGTYKIRLTGVVKQNETLLFSDFDFIAGVLTAYDWCRIKIDKEARIITDLASKKKYKVSFFK